MIKNRIFMKAVFSTLLFIAVILSASGTINLIIEKTPLINAIDTHAESYYDKSIKRSLYAYAIARGFNAIISFMQEVKFNVVLTIPFGQVLDPVNDLIERFSLVILISTISLGIQKILMEIGAWLGFKVILAISLFVLSIALWLPDPHKPRYMSLGYKMVIIAIFIRFCIPVLGMATNKTYDLFLEEKTEHATAALEEYKAEMETVQLSAMELSEGRELNNGSQAVPSGMWDKVKGMYKSASSHDDIKAKLEEIKKTVAEAIEFFVNLIIVFILETVVIPLVGLWMIIRAARYLLGRSFSAAFV